MKKSYFLFIFLLNLFLLDAHEKSKSVATSADIKIFSDIEHCIITYQDTKSKPKIAHFLMKIIKCNLKNNTKNLTFILDEEPGNIFDESFYSENNFKKNLEKVNEIIETISNRIALHNDGKSFIDNEGPTDDFYIYKKNTIIMRLLLAIQKDALGTKNIEMLNMANIILLSLAFYQPIHTFMDFNYDLLEESKMYFSIINGEKEYIKPMSDRFIKNKTRYDKIKKIYSEYKWFKEDEAIFEKIGKLGIYYAVQLNNAIAKDTLKIRMSFLENHHENLNFLEGEKSRFPINSLYQKIDYLCKEIMYDSIAAGDEPIDKKNLEQRIIDIVNQSGIKSSISQTHSNALKEALEESDEEEVIDYDLFIDDPIKITEHNRLKEWKKDSKNAIERQGYVSGDNQFKQNLYEQLGEDAIVSNHIFPTIMYSYMLNHVHKIKKDESKGSVKIFGYRLSSDKKRTFGFFELGYSIEQQKQNLKSRSASVAQQEAINIIHRLFKEISEKKLKSLKKHNPILRDEKLNELEAACKKETYSDDEETPIGWTSNNEKEGWEAFSANVNGIDDFIMFSKNGENNHYVLMFDPQLNKFE